MPYTVLMPVIASTVLHGGPHTLGFLMTASGVGALAGALYLALAQSVLGLGRRILVATALFGPALDRVLRSRARCWLSLAVLPVVGAGLMHADGGHNTILQTIVEDDMRGRVMAFYTMAFLGTAPSAACWPGALADRIGARDDPDRRRACLAGAAWFASNRLRLARTSGRSTSSAASSPGTPTRSSLSTAAGSGSSCPGV